MDAKNQGITVGSPFSARLTVSKESKPHAEILAERSPGRSSDGVRTDSQLTGTLPYFVVIAGLFIIIISSFHYNDEFNEVAFEVLFGQEKYT